MPEGYNLTVLEPGAPAGQVAAVIGSTPAGNPTVTYTNPGGYGTTYTTALAGPPTSSSFIGAGAGIVGAVPQQNPVQMQPTPLPAIIPAAQAVIPALGALGITVPAAVGTAVAGAGAIFGLLQALGLGEGGGLFGNNLLGGDTSYIGGIPLGGPGLAEPPAQYVIKEWSRDTAAGRVQYYKVQMPNMRKPVTLGYYTAFKRWVRFKAPHLAVIGKKLPSHRQLTRLKRNLVRHSADARTILKITSPASLKQGRGKYRR